MRSLKHVLRRLKRAPMFTAISLVTLALGIGATTAIFSVVALRMLAAAGLTRLMSSLLFGITPLDPLTYATVPVFLLAAVALASYVPARRATTIDPVEALRAE